jgi:hypothetical protein
MLSRSLPTIRARSMSCSEVRVRVYVLFSIPQIYGDISYQPNRVGVVKQSFFFIKNPPTKVRQKF